MLLEEYGKECTIELQFLAEVVQAIESLLADNTGDTAPLKDRAAAASFVFSFYNGIKNLLKRTTKYCAVPLPKGEQWHSALAMRFADPAGSGFPIIPQLIIADIHTDLLKLRKLRHVIAHGYAMNLDWLQMKPTIEAIPGVYRIVRQNLEQLLATQQP
jgi:hypothetical protein